MGYPKEVYDRAWQIMEQRKQAARNETISRREKALRAAPEIEGIERQMAKAAASVIQVVANDPESSGEKIQKLQSRSLSLQRQREVLLEQNGFPPDYLAEVHHCGYCKDTGYIMNEMCRCLSDLLKQEAAKTLGAFVSGDSSRFSDFSLDYYPARPLDSSGVIPRERMSQILDYCADYAKSFQPDGESILMLGQTGLGKTHLSLAIARQVTEAGYGVVYSPVQRLMDKLESEKFSRSQEGREKYAGNTELAFTCDLLILDDLGAEFITQFTSAILYNIINTRMVEQRPTIISTNLELGQIEEKYSQRVMSRLVCGYKVLKFYGKDIRFLKKQAPQLI